MQCLLCNTADVAGACSFHPGRPVLSHNLGAYGDYNDAFIWSCCSRFAESSVDAKGGYILPSRSPGCVVREKHTSLAAIHFCCSKQGRELALNAANALKGSGFFADISDIRSPAVASIAGAACVVFLSTANDAPIVEDWLEALANQTAPRAVVCFLDNGDQRSRIHKAEPDNLVHAAIQGVRQKFTQGALNRFKVFLSYRRADSAISAAVHRFTAQCWWDNAALDPGVDWASEIVTAIEACRLFVLVVRDPLPPASYVWKELNLALKHEKPIAILSFGSGGEELLAKCGSYVGEMKLAGIWADRPVAGRPRDRLRFSCHSASPPKLLYFSDMYEQLRIAQPSSRTTEDRETYGTPNSVKLFNFLGGYPESCDLVRFL
jgi:hypothetical protein